MATLNEWQRLWVALTVPFLAYVGLRSVSANGVSVGAVEVIFGWVVLWVAFSGFLYVVGFVVAWIWRGFQQRKAWRRGRLPDKGTTREVWPVRKASRCRPHASSASRFSRS